jgi:hypothetical protein
MMNQRDGEGGLVGEENTGSFVARLPMLLRYYNADTQCCTQTKHPHDTQISRLG